MKRGYPKGLVLIPDEQAFVEIARLPLLHRLLLSGHKADIQDWLLLSRLDVSHVRSNLMTETKLDAISWHVYDMFNTSPVHITPALRSEGVLVISCTAVFDHRLLLALQARAGVTLWVTPASAGAGSATMENVRVQDGQARGSASAAQETYDSPGLLCCPGDVLAHALDKAWTAMQGAPDPFQPLLQHLSAATSVQVFNARQYLWVSLTPPLATSVTVAEKQLLRYLGREGESPLVRMLNRRVSRALTKWLLRTPITPNYVTLFSALLGLCGAACLAQPSHFSQVLGSLLFLLSTITDGCDGEIARLTFQETPFGAKFDVIMDNVVHLFLFPCIAIGLYRQQGQDLHLMLGGLALGGVLVSMAVYLPALLRRETAWPSRARLHESLASRDFALALPILALCRRLDWFLWATGVGTYLFAAAWVVITWLARRQQKRTLVSDKSSLG
jgi:1L-myo-inositol 1-phosphate cytidylyltransferase / CDP-L-myo-inositol myo-inositolphosphotransferase